MIGGNMIVHLERIKPDIATWLGVAKDEVTFNTRLPLDIEGTDRCIEDLLATIAVMYEVNPFVLEDEGVRNVGELCIYLCSLPRDLLW